MSHDNGDLFDRMINDPEIQRRIDAMSEQQHVTITYMGGLISILRKHCTGRSMTLVMSQSKLTTW